VASIIDDQLRRLRCASAKYGHSQVWVPIMPLSH